MGLVTSQVEAFAWSRHVAVAESGLFGEPLPHVLGGAEGKPVEDHDAYFVTLHGSRGYETLLNDFDLF